MGTRDVFSVPAVGGSLVGWVSGSGVPVLLLHGGPGLGYSYLDDLGAELAVEFRVASFQQRGLEPSTVEGPFTIAQALEDVLAVLDGLAWPQTFVVGHSWGAHLGLRLAASHPERLLGLLAIEPIGVVGDGGFAASMAELEARTSKEGRTRLQKLDEREQAGGATDADFEESVKIAWPAYFADPENVPAMRPVRASTKAYSGLVAGLTTGLEPIAAAISRGEVLIEVLAGAGSPIPWGQASRATVELSARASLTVISAAGHFPWMEVPGCAADALKRLAARAADTSDGDKLTTDQATADIATTA